MLANRNESTSLVDVARSLQTRVESELLRVEQMRHDAEELQATVQRDRASLEEEKRFFAAMNKESADIVRVNAGGKIFQTMRATLCQVQDSMLAKMFSGRWDESLKRDESGAVFLDVSPACFNVVLSYLRSRTFDPSAKFPDADVPSELRAEMQAFLKFMMLTEDEDDPELDGSLFTLARICGDFCGGRTWNHCNTDVHYNNKHFEDILRGVVPESTPEERCAIYCGVHWRRGTTVDPTIEVHFPTPRRVRGFKVMVARESGCRWRVLKDGLVLYSGNPFAYPGGQRLPDPKHNPRILRFHQEIVTEKLVIIIDDFQDNIGFYSVSFF
mmetsp:Transcript_63385/g.137994  ORF Transcript_63385/g.137994 Transcript_63385/m.137994 type:complete len:328 (+) Transcript_63385:131-1114(+)